MIQEEKRQKLLNEDIVEMKNKKRFEGRDPERSIHTEIPPAAIRIQGIKKRELSAKFDQKKIESLK
jgi:hypothetical protein